MSLSKAMLWSVGQSAVRFAVGFIGVKVTAVYLGPAGMALVGQFNNFLSMCTLMTVGGVQTGLAKMTAQAAPDDDARHTVIWSTAARLALILGGGSAVLIALASYWLSEHLLLNRAYWPIFLFGALVLFAGTANGVASGILNGMRRMHALALGVMISSILSLLLSVPLVYFFNVWGGMISAGLLVFLTAAISICFFYKEIGHGFRYFRAGYDSGVGRELLRFYPMVLANALSSQCTLIAVRYLISHQLGADAAGIWQASIKVSDMYTAVIVSALSLYLMPHLSSIKDDIAFRREVFAVSLKVATATALIAGVIFLTRDLVILIVFTRQFDAMRGLFQYQLIGDILMVACWPMRMGLTVRLKVRQYLAIETLNAVVFIFGTYLLLENIGIAGAPLAYAIGYFLSLGCLIALYFAQKANGSTSPHHS